MSDGFRTVPARGDPVNVRDDAQAMTVADRRDGPTGGAGGTTYSRAPQPVGSPDEIARRALDVGRRTALGVLAGDTATADDVAQEVAIQAVRHAHRLREAAALDAWLYRTAVRAALKSVRRGRRQRAVEQDHVVHAVRTSGGDRDEPPTAALEELGRLLRGLPERQRAALTLRYAHDLADDEIATALRCRPGTVRALLSRGRSAVRERLEAEASAGGDPTSAAPTPEAPTEGDERVTD